MTTATAVRQDRQRAFEEAVIHDAELETFLERYLNLKTAAALTGRPYRRAHKELSQRLGEKALNKRVRIGPYVVTGMAIEGGDIEIPPWQSVRVKVEKA